MATITLYKDKVNGVESLLDDIIKSSNNLNTQLGTLKNTLQTVDKSGESGIINNNKCDIAPNKINKFFLEPVHIESKPTQQRMNMRNNTHSFSVNSFNLIVF